MDNFHQPPGGNLLKKQETAQKWENKEETKIETNR